MVTETSHYISTGGFNQKSFIHRN